MKAVVASSSVVVVVKSESGKVLLLLKFISRFIVVTIYLFIAGGVRSVNLVCGVTNLLLLFCISVQLHGEKQV